MIISQGVPCFTQLTLDTEVEYIELEAVRGVDHVSDIAIDRILILTGEGPQTCKCME